jgi:hypothetical protein
MNDDEACRKAWELLGRAAAGWPVAPEVWEIIRQGYSGSRNSVSPTNAFLQAVKRSQMAGKKIPVMEEVTPVAVDPREVPPPKVRAASIPFTVGTFTRQGLNGYTEIVDSKTGAVVGRWLGEPKND